MQYIFPTQSLYPSASEAQRPISRADRPASFAYARLLESGVALILHKFRRKDQGSRKSPMGTQQQ
jgi:hypothetical protein